MGGTPKTQRESQSPAEGDPPESAGLTALPPRQYCVVVYLPENCCICKLNETGTFNPRRIVCIMIQFWLLLLGVVIVLGGVFVSFFGDASFNSSFNIF